MLAGHKAQRLIARRAQVQHQQILGQALDLVDPRGHLLARDIANTFGLAGFDDQIFGGMGAAHQECPLGLVLIVDDVIVKACFAEPAGHQPCAALPTGAVAATVTWRQTGTQRGLEQRLLGLGRKFVVGRQEVNLGSHKLKCNGSVGDIGLMPGRPSAKPLANNR